MTHRSASCIRTAVLVAASLLPPSAARAVVLPPGFVVENAVPGAGFNQPTAFAATPDGRILVAEKRGMVRVVQNGIKLAEPLWSAESEVLNNGDRGLIGIAVDPRYAVNRYVYFLYTVDPDSDNVDINDDAFGRLTRYATRADNPNLLDPASRTVLVGATWRDGFASGSPSHSVGDLQWGADGSLFVSCGEGAQYSRADSGGRDPNLFALGRTDPDEDIGAFRAQYLGSIAGKVLRLNPANGFGYTSNPYFDGDLSSNRSRVWSYGLRNPYRLSLRPATGSADTAAADPAVLYVHDCGWRDFEEIDVSRGGENFGWPCMEGPLPQAAYAWLAPAHHGCGTLGGPDNPALSTLPVVAWAQLDSAHSIPFGLRGTCTGGGTFYAGRSYPVEYRDRLFFADFGKGWIQAAAFDGRERLIDVVPFAQAAEGPVFFGADPATGDLLYLAILTGRLYRIRYTGPAAGAAAPRAMAEADRLSGLAPLAVQFTSAGSYHPDLEPFGVHWAFGDGEESTLAAPLHAYDVPGEYAVVLTVDDGHGGIDRDSLTVRVEAPLGVESIAGSLALSAAFPNPSAARVFLTLDLPRAAPVTLTAHDLLGRAVWATDRRDYAAGRWTLEWPGTTRGGARAPAGLYLVRVHAGGHVLTRRFALLR